LERLPAGIVRNENPSARKSEGTNPYEKWGNSQETGLSGFREKINAVEEDKSVPLITDQIDKKIMGPPGKIDFVIPSACNKVAQEAGGQMESC